jgi:hypothetical protein
LVGSRFEVADGRFEMFHMLQVHPEHESMVVRDSPLNGIA